MTVTSLRLDLIDEWEARVVDTLRGTRFAQVDFSAFDHNVRLGLLRQDAFRSTLSGFAVVPPGMELAPDGMRFVDRISGRVPEAASYDTVLERAKDFFSRFVGRRIAVQCSGGLDSSIIAAVLRELEIPFTLIGLSTKRYEFRTERRIQEKLCRSARDCRLIDYELVLPMSSANLLRETSTPSLLHCLSN